MYGVRDAQLIRVFLFYWTQQMILLFILPLFNLVHSQTLPSSNDGRFVCYHTSWGAYRPGDYKFTPKNINPYLCTHLIYSFANVLVEEGTIVPGDAWQDIDNNQFTDFVELKTKFNDNLLTLLAVGGYREASTKFTPISAMATKREMFAKNSLEFLKKYGFDGLNIDWQFPTDKVRNGTDEDYQNFVYLLRDIDKAFREEATATGKPKMTLTISVPGNTLLIKSGYDLPNIEKYVEFINVLCYDYHFAYDPAVYHHSPLYPLPNEVQGSGHENEGANADSTIQFILSKGVPSNKLNLGIPLYGRSLQLVDANENTLGSPATGQGAKGKATREEGQLAYYEICKNVKEGWKVMHPNETAMGPYAYKGNQWVAYDDENSVRRKGEYAKKNGLGGLSFWAIDQDDFLASCGKRAYPLIKAGREGYMKVKVPGAGVEKLTTAPTVARPKTTINFAQTMRSGEEQSRVRPANPEMEIQSINTATDDLDDSEIVDVITPTPHIPVKITATRTPGGMFQNIYIWITNNIFHNSSPQFIDTTGRPKIQLAPKKPPPIPEPEVQATGEVKNTQDVYEDLQRSAPSPARRGATFHEGAPVWTY